MCGGVSVRVCGPLPDVWGCECEGVLVLLPDVWGMSVRVCWSLYLICGV